MYVFVVGVWGEFEVIYDNLDIILVVFFNGIGKKFKVFMCIFIVGLEVGIVEIVWDVRGWLMKIFIEEGN